MCAGEHTYRERVRGGGEPQLPITNFRKTNTHTPFSRTYTYTSLGLIITLLLARNYKIARCRRTHNGFPTTSNTERNKKLVFRPRLASLSLSPPKIGGQKKPIVFPSGAADCLPPRLDGGGGGGGGGGGDTFGAKTCRFPKKNKFLLQLSYALSLGWGVTRSIVGEINQNPFPSSNTFCDNNEAIQVPQCTQKFLLIY